MAEERSALAGKLEGKLSAFQRGEEDDNSAAQLSPQELSECMRSCAAVARRRGARDDDVAAMVNVRQFQATPKASRTGFLSILAVLQSVVLFLLLLLAKGSLYADTCRIDQLRTTS